jgi:glycerate-2-kinase
VGFGKIALAATKAVYEQMGSRIDCGFVIDLKEGQVGNLVCRVGTHPYPTEVNVAATTELMAMLEGATEDDFVICVVGGGGSSLLCSPHNMSCDTETQMIASLTRKGADIFELNTVRKHISKVKGGNLAKICYPATMVSLVYSDVPGDDLSMVASGPTVKDTTSMHDAAAILKKYDVLLECQLPSCELLETPKDEKYFANVHNILMVSPKSALRAMQLAAKDLGYRAEVFSDHFQGDSVGLGARIAKASLAPRTCLLGVGESTMKFTKNEPSGRNMTMALAALPHMPPGRVLVPLDTDGHDNTPAAGALVDEAVFVKATQKGLDSKTMLANNQSYKFFSKAEALVFCTETHANASDLFVCLQA